MMENFFSLKSGCVLIKGRGTEMTEIWGSDR